MTRTIVWVAAVLAAVVLPGCQLASVPPSAAPPSSPTARAVVVSPVPPATATPAGRGVGSPVATATALVAPTAVAGASPTLSAGTAPRTATRVAPSPTPRVSPAAPTLGRAVSAGGSPTAAPGSGGLLPSGGERLTGEVTTFAASARVLQLRVDGGGERQVSLAPNAAIRRADGAPAPSADVRPGQRVQVTGRPGAEGALLADEVVLLGGR